MVDSDKTPWHILGCGAIGSLWANYLMKSGTPAVVLCRTPEQLDSFWDNPSLTLIEDGKRHKYQPQTQIINHHSPIEQLLVTTKSYNTLDAINAVAHRITPDTRIVLLQNGMGPQQQIAQQFSQCPVYCGTTTEGAYRTGPQQVIHAGIGETWIGPLNDASQQLGQTAIDSLFALDLTTHYEEQIHDRLWKKLAINCAINGLTAIHDCHNGELLDNPSYRAELETLCDEVEMVARYLKQPLFEESLFDAVTTVATATAENISSTLQDTRAHRPTEIEYLNGYLCRKADDLNLDIPHHRQVLEQVRQLSQDETRLLNPLS